jgi:phenylalanyl-tRNA synthetase alpha chain
LHLADLKNLQEKIAPEIQQATTEEELEALRIKYLGRKGILTQAISDISNLPNEERPEFGRLVNILKKNTEDLITRKKEELKTTSAGEKQALDLTLPAIKRPVGHQHLLTQVLDEICQIFLSFGFQIVQGPEIETEFNNFTGLNIPLEHPSRDVFDTFYLKSSSGGCEHRTPITEHLLLRSHTSPVQIRAMKTRKPPLAVIVPGKVYRPDAVDASHSFMFHQVEGFLVDKDVKFSDLKGILELFAKKIFTKEIKMRFRPHFFPFTEPSAEVDISCFICGGRGCSVCGKKGWLEILGSGMIHPNVFKAVGYNPAQWRGFAFGMGVERIAMLKHGISDIRLFFENDLRFLRQF